MTLYRKLYNDNILGTSDISILKFYYASFKIQYSKGKITDISRFLDECAKISDDTNLLLKLFGFLPLVNLCFGTGTEQKRIAEIIRTKRREVENLFLQDEISDEEVIQILYGVTNPANTNSTRSVEEQLDLSKEYILKCYSINRRKQLGDRMFGYLLKAEVIEAYSPQERLDVWYRFVGENIKPSNPKLHATPNLQRSKFGKENLSLPEQLETIYSFFAEIGLQSAANIVRSDIGKLYTEKK